MMPLIRHTAMLFLGCLVGSSMPRNAAAEHHEGAKEGASRLLGAWRLIAVEYSGPHGETVDPYYQPGSTGVIIYDASGWMSVQIGAPHRRAWTMAEVRVPAVAGNDEGLKAEAFDTYYAYYGTWQYDPASLVVTHHLESSMIPAEAGLSYPQSVTFDAGRLIFTVRSGTSERQTVRKKVWERLPALSGRGG